MRAEQDTQTDPRQPSTGLEKCQGEGETFDMKKAPLLRRAALEMLLIVETSFCLQPPRLVHAL